MVFESDPLRTLGLPPGATQAEIKAAYRRLAKAFHPDTAGEAAIPRFLAIQAAYETLTGTTVRARRPGRAQPAWRADPERARTTREAWRERGSAAGGRGRPETGARPDGRRAAGESRAEGKSDAGPRSRTSRDRSRDRAPDRATPGSTTYDAAADEPFDPDWSGASWYGTTSGTYWTINPKEYADPRKHGPEYQARGRRRGPGAPPPEPDDPLEAPIAKPRRAASDDPPSAPGPTGFDGRWATPEVQRAGSFRPPIPLRGTAARRVALALIGWPPLGVLVAALIGDTTGCSRFAAGCDSNIGIGVWLAQVALIGTLLVVPRLAAISSTGTIVALAAAVPATLLLSVSGGPQERAASVAALTVVLGVAYVVGVILGAIGGSRTLRA